MTLTHDDDSWESGGEISGSGTPIELPPKPTVEGGTATDGGGASAGGSMRKLSDVLTSAFNLMDARAEKREKPISTPWSDFNEQLPGGGFWPGCHILVSGTGAGKSTWALQLALHAARDGAAVVYAGLELEDEQVAIRLAGSVSGVGWSKLYTGQATAAECASARGTVTALSNLPFYIEAGAPMGWPASRIRDIAKQTREAHPNGPILIVVDFLQLIGAEENGHRQDLRERIGRAAYVARHAGKEYGVTVLLISSVARHGYPLVSGFAGMVDAGIRKDPNGARRISHPDVFVGLGKESGEIEFSADSVTVAISAADNGAGDRDVVFATAKLRAGRPSWCSLSFNGWAFRDDPTHGERILKAMPKAPGGSGRNPPGSEVSGTVKPRKDPPS